MHSRFLMLVFVVELVRLSVQLELSAWEMANLKSMQISASSVVLVQVLALQVLSIYKK